MYGFAVIILMQCLGMFISEYMHLILPGNLIGLLLLFAALVLKIVKLKAVEDSANFLLDNMMLYFVPLNVGLVTVLPQLKKELGAVLISVIASTIIVLVVTSKAVEITERRPQNAKKPSA